MGKTEAFVDLFMIIFIHLVLPIAGIVAYFRLLRKMRKEEVPNMPRISFFMLFFIYGGVLMTIFTGLFWKSSGMSSLGLLFLIFVAPVMCGIIAWRYRNISRISSYHRILRRMALGYLWGEIVLIIIGVILSITKIINV